MTGLSGHSVLCRKASALFCSVTFPDPSTGKNYLDLEIIFDRFFFLYPNLIGNYFDRCGRKARAKKRKKSFIAATGGLQYSARLLWDR